MDTERSIMVDVDDLFRVKARNVRRWSMRYVNPWVLDENDYAEQTGSAIPLAELIGDEDDDRDSGLDGPQRTDGSSDLSLLSFETRQHCADTSDSLDWDYSDVLRLTTSDVGFKNVDDIDYDNDAAAANFDGFCRHASLASAGTHVWSESGASDAARRSVDSQPQILWKHRRVIVVAVDGGDAGDIALDYYLDHVHRQANIVCLVHCVPIPKIPFCEELPPREYSQMIEDSREKARFLVSLYKLRFKRMGIVHTTRIIHSDHSAESIIHAAKEVNAQAIVAGRRKLSYLRRALIGGVSDRLLRRSPIPVWIYPPKKQSSFNWCGFPITSSQPNLLVSSKHHQHDNGSDSTSLTSSV